VDHLKLAAELLALAQARSVRMATVESCTGGLLAGAITDIPGASDIFERGYVTYSNSAKRDLVGVKQSTLDRHGAVSEQVACEMAEGGLRGSTLQSRSPVSLARVGPRISLRVGCVLPCQHPANPHKAKPLNLAQLAGVWCANVQCIMR